MSKNSNQNSRRNFLFGLSSLTIATAIGELENRGWGSTISSNGLKPLKELAAERGIVYGSYIEGKYQKFLVDPEFRALFVRECALLVAGFQWSRIYKNNNSFDFSSTDALAEFATKNKLLLRGQPLVYHQFQPQWLIDKFKDPQTNSDEIRSIFTNTISRIVSRYSVYSWVVVNEAIRIADGRTDGLRDTTHSSVLSSNGWGKYPTWLHFLGTEYIDLAFRTAANGDPGAMLLLNENSLCYNIPEEEGKRFAVLNLLKDLKSKNTPVHALGIQAHLDASKNKFFDPEKFGSFLEEVASLGLKIVISELDVTDRYLPADVNMRDRLVAEAYRDFLAVALTQPAVVSVTTWGLSDRYTWLSWHAPRQDKLAVRPLPYSDRLEPKPAYLAIAAAFKNAPKR